MSHAPGDVRRIVTFRLGDDLFAVEIGQVERVLAYQAPRQLPGMPAWVEGVVDYHYRVIPVIDLRRRFSLPDAPLGTHARLLVLTAREEWIAVVVDGVLDVRAVREEELTPPPPFFRGLAGEFLRGMTRRDDRLVVLLDPDRLFATHETLSLDGAAGEPSPAGGSYGVDAIGDLSFDASLDGFRDG